MSLAAFTWPVATVIAVAIGAVGLIVAIGVWQTFAVVVRDDRQAEREFRQQQANATKA
jgi:heme exporter protein D